MEQEEPRSQGGQRRRHLHKDRNLMNHQQRNIRLFLLLETEAVGGAKPFNDLGGGNKESDDEEGGNWTTQRHDTCIPTH